MTDAETEANDDLDVEWVSLSETCTLQRWETMLSSGVRDFVMSRAAANNVDECLAACVDAEVDVDFVSRVDPVVVEQLTEAWEWVEEADKQELWRRTLWAGYHFARNMLGTAELSLMWSKWADDPEFEGDELWDCVHFVETLDATDQFGQGNGIWLPDVLDRPDIDEDSVMAFDQGVSLGLFEYQRTETGEWPDRSGLVCMCDADES